MVSASAGRRPCSLKAFIKDTARGSPSNTTSSYLFVALTVEVAYPRFPPSAFSFSTYSKASPSPSIAFPILPSPTPTTLDVFPDVSSGEV